MKNFLRAAWDTAIGIPILAAAQLGILKSQSGSGRLSQILETCFGWASIVVVASSFAAGLWAHALGFPWILGFVAYYASICAAWGLFIVLVERS